MKSLKNKKLIYFHDPLGDTKEEVEGIVLELQSQGYDIESTDIIPTNTPPFDEKFDVLFFDWGGMSLGNSMIDHFCNHIIKLANDNPSRCFVMTSLQTMEAMTEAIREFGETPPNIFYYFYLFSQYFEKYG